jgi:hypothetical protein
MSQHFLAFGGVVNPHPEVMESLSLINPIDACRVTLYELHVGWTFVRIGGQDWPPRRAVGVIGPSKRFGRSEP